jgi:hypothetical protein
MKRDEEIINLRPVIPSIENTKGITDIERFQNNTLRPVLKFQNEVLVDVIKSNNHYKSLLKEINSDKDSLVSIKDFINKETQLKLTIIGTLIGLFTLSEFSFYNEKAKELNKRIIQMASQRFFDNNNF